MACFLKAAWGALRLCSAAILIVLGFWFAAMIVISAPWKTRESVTADPMVCGTLSNVVYEFPRSYVIYWPEYEGKSSWEVGFTQNKKGCDANLRSLYMAMSWPEMQPVSHSQATSFSFDGISVAIEPWQHGEAGLRRQLHHYLRKTSVEKVKAVKFNEALGLNFLVGVDSAFPSNRKGFFWSESNERMQYVGHCNWVEYKSSYTRCYLEFLMPGEQSIVEVEFLWGRLAEWHNIVSGVSEFLVGGVKYGVSK